VKKVLLIVLNVHLCSILQILKAKKKKESKLYLLIPELPTLTHSA